MAMINRSKRPRKGPAELLRWQRRPPRPRYRTMHVDEFNGPRVIVGPELGKVRRCDDEGPRLRIDGRWLSAVRASHRLYVVRRGGTRRWPQVERMRNRIWVFLGRFDDCPF